MNFDFDDEQDLLRKTIRTVLTNAYDTTTRNTITATERGYSPEVWGHLAELGVLGLPFGADVGGADAGPIEVMIAMTEIGRALAPEPFLDAVLLPGRLVASAGTTAQRNRLLPDVIAGTSLLALAHEEPGSRWPATTIATTAVQHGQRWVLSGRKNPVLAGHIADTLVVSANTDDAQSALFLVSADAAGLTRTPYATHDSRHGAQLTLTDTPAELLGDTAADARALIDGALRHAHAALCAESVGLMTETLHLTTQYLKQRKQFGAPLSQFQALTHRAADMYVQLEMATSMSYFVSMSLAEGELDPLQASQARFYIGRAARLIGQEAVQMHGGIGITAEYPVGHYLSRLTAIGHTLGSVDDHRRVLIDGVSIQ